MIAGKVLLITPPYHCGVVEAAGRWLPLGFVSIAGALREKGYEVQIYDAMTKYATHEDIRRHIIETRPAIVATGAYTSTAEEATKLLATAKDVDASTVTVIGGVHPTFCYEEMLEADSSVDYVVRGEGEVTFPALVDALCHDSDLAGVPGLAFRRAAEVVTTAERPFIEDLDALKPAWDLLDWEDYTYFIFPGSRLAIVSSSRGCDRDCSFCSQRKFWKQSWRARDPGKLIDEMEMLRDRHGVNVFMLSDEFPTRDRDRWEAILDGLIQRQLGAHILMETTVEDIVRDHDIMDKYRKSGIVHVYIGVEATDQERLDRFHKNIGVEQSREAIRLINSVGMISETSFVFGMPEETKESIAATLRLAEEYDPDFAHFLMIAPWPYADIYGELQPYIEAESYSCYNLIDPVVRSKALSRDELFQESLNCYRTFYMKKLPRWAALKDGFKRNYLLTSMRAIMKNSFLTQHRGRLGKMPKEVEKQFAALEGSGGR